MTGLHPALLRVLAAILSGAGYGLLAWLGLSLFMLHTRADLMPVLQPVYLWGLGAGLVLSTVGLLRALRRPGQPRPAWRALGQWRTSWLSREGVLAMATPLPAAAMFALLLTDPGPGRALALGVCGLLLAPLALATVACTAMTHATLPPSPAWRDRLMVPVYLLFALLTGLALLFWLMVVVRPFTPAESGTLLTLGLLGTLLAACKLVYWYRIDRQSLPCIGADTVPPPEQDASVYMLARHHARALRAATVALLAGVPLLAWALASSGALATTGLLACTCLALLAGAFAERWLFFAQTRHGVALHS